MKNKFLIVLFLISVGRLMATHNRAGEITYVHKTGFTYEFTITTYTKDSAPADRCELTIDFGDGTDAVFYRVNGLPNNCGPTARDGEVLSGANDVRKNVYRGSHTYSSPGYFTISVQDKNRNDGVANIPASVYTPFYITTTVLIDPSIGYNSSPILTYPPIDEGCVFKTYIHNPGAYDPDGDSLSYELIDCRGLGGAPIAETYDSAYVTDPVKIDSVIGDFIWDTPQRIGEYNFAILIREYRRAPNGTFQLLGSVTRDFQVNIKGCGNNPPKIKPLGPFCVEVGQTLTFQVVATDPDNDQVKLTGFGGLLDPDNTWIVPKASFPQPTYGIGTVSQTFSWTPACNNVRKQPFYAQFKAEDVPPPTAQPPLSDLMSVEITVVAPAPKNPAATPSTESIEVSWNQEECSHAIGYHLYRKEGLYGFNPDTCETGIPDYTGYEYQATLNGIGDTTYEDSLNLKKGVQYCYMVYAFFADGAESYASVEVCTELPKTAPIITHVDVKKTGVNDGEILVDWIPPREIDSLAHPPPYSYVLERAEGIAGDNFIQIAALTNFTDTSFLDQSLNTVDDGFNYRVGFLSNGNLIATSDPASSVFLSVFPANRRNELTFKYNTPWVNDSIIVYRETTPGSGIFDSIGLTSNKLFIDTGLVNGEEYCYRGLALGRYSGTGTPKPLLNYSQIDCAIPLDTTKPCAPYLDANAFCEQGRVELSWKNDTAPGCEDDIAYYNLYYKLLETDPWILLFSLPPTSTDTVIQAESIVGCYAITAVDGAAVPNESDYSEVVCVPACPVITLPNVFTPNNMGINDYFKPILIKHVKELRIDIYNRWGGVVYRAESIEEFTEQPWDGRDMSTGSNCADGVYYYLLIYTPRDTKESEEKYIKGFIHLFR